MTTREKAALRQAIRAAWPGQARQDEESAAICRHLTAWAPFRQAEVVGGYMPMAQEADITPLLKAVLASGRALALPRCGQPPEMTFHRVLSLGELLQGRWGIPEPREDAPVIPPEALSLVLTPLEGTDAQGRRLGKGGGYYDRLLASTRALAVGVALSWQIVPRVPVDPWDKPLDALADAAGVRMLPPDRRRSTNHAIEPL